MKTFLIAIALALCSVTTADASWYWVLADNGYYLRSNGSENDGFYYSKKCHSGCRGCGHCQYVPVKVIAPVVQYSKDWTNNMTNATYSLLDKQLFLQAQKELSKLAPSGYASGYDYASSTIYRGGTLNPFGYNELPDGNAIAHSLERVGIKMTETTGQTAAALGAATQQAIEGNKQLLAYQAFGQMIQPQPTTEVHTYQQQGGSVSALGPPPLASLNNLLGVAIGNRSCVSCHSGASPKADLDLAAISTYSQDDRNAIADEALDRMVGEKSKDPSQRMPPKGPLKTPDEANAIADWIRGQPSQPLRVYRSKSQTQEELK